MLISNPMNAALNQQIGYEFGASLQYVAIAAHFDSESLPELARHYYRQAEEERGHAMRIVKFVVDAGGRVEVPTIPAPQSRFGTTEEAVKKALEGEITVTQEINPWWTLPLKKPITSRRTSCSGSWRSNWRRFPARRHCFGSCSAPGSRTCCTSRSTWRVIGIRPCRQPPKAMKPVADAGQPHQYRPNRS